MIINSPEVIEQLCNDNIKLTTYVAKKVTRNHLNEDIISAANLGLLHAARTYDTNIGKFSGYAAMCIKNAICMLFRKEKNKPKTISLDEPCVTKLEGCELTLGEMLPAKEELNFEIYDALEKYFNTEKKLSQSDILKRKTLSLYINGKTQIEIAEILNKSQSYISRVITKAISEFKKLYEEIV